MPAEHGMKYSYCLGRAASYLLRAASILEEKHKLTTEEVDLIEESKTGLTLQDMAAKHGIEARFMSRQLNKAMKKARGPQ